MNAIWRKLCKNRLFLFKMRTINVKIALSFYPYEPVFIDKTVYKLLCPNIMYYTYSEKQSSSYDNRNYNQCWTRARTRREIILIQRQFTNERKKLQQTHQ